jgi:hypothetical protein
MESMEIDDLQNDNNNNQYDDVLEELLDQVDVFPSGSEEPSIVRAFQDLANGVVPKQFIDELGEQLEEIVSTNGETGILRMV